MLWLNFASRSPRHYRATKSAPSCEYGVSEFDVWIALSSGEKTRATLLIVFYGALESGLARSTKYEYWMR